MPNLEPIGLPYEATPLLSLAEHEAFGAIEDESNAFLDVSLEPRGPEMLYELVAGLGLPERSAVVDVGSGTGRHTVELARRFGFDVLGVDPTALHRDMAIEYFRHESASAPELAKRVSFADGSVERLPVPSGSIDLVWCRDVLSLVEDLDAAYGEVRRVLKPGGRAVVYQMFTTELLEPREAAWLLPIMGCLAASMEPARVEQAIHASGLQIDECHILGTEWGEYGQEQSGRGATKLIRAARLLRNRERYVARFGQTNYDIALGDCLWHVYRLIGKLSDRVYVLSARSQ